MIILLAKTASCNVIFTQLADTDTGSAAGSTFWARRIGTPEPCGTYDHHPPCNITYLETACRITCGCAGFNSNGWLKSCVSSSCGAEVKYPFPGTDTYVASSILPCGPTPPPPPSPSPCVNSSSTAGSMLPPVEDIHYPTEEPFEHAFLLKQLPVVVSLKATNNSTCTATLKLALNNTQQVVQVGDLAFGFWQVVSCIASPGQESLLAQSAIPDLIVLEARFSRWSALVYLSQAPPPEIASAYFVIRSGLGLVSSLKQIAYNFPDPCYFKRATLHPEDYLRAWLLNTSKFNEPTFSDAAALLAPVHDYAIVGVPSAYHQWSVTQDGFIKRAETAIYGPVDGTDSTKAGVTVFSPKSQCSWWPALNFSDYKSSLYGHSYQVPPPHTPSPSPRALFLSFFGSCP